MHIQSINEEQQIQSEAHMSKSVGNDATTWVELIEVYILLMYVYVCMFMYFTFNENK